MHIPALIDVARIPELREISAGDRRVRLGAATPIQRFLDDSALARALPCMIVPFPAGGPSDTVARIAADGMTRHLGQNVVIENVGGAGGTIGATRAAEAAPDGYTILAASMGTVIAAPSFYPNLKYDSTKDFEPIGMATTTAAGRLMPDPPPSAETCDASSRNTSATTQVPMAK